MRSRTRLAVCLLLTLACRAQRPLDPRTESRLWGVEGNRWTPTSQLPDFSQAGYHAGRDPLPDVPVAANVRDFGAVGDGETDDSAAFLRALSSVNGGAILVPPGRYLITEVLRIEKSGVVLRGAGRDETTLYFPESLFEALGRGPDSGPLGWSWTGGWIWARGELPDSPALANVTAAAARGSSRLAISPVSDIEEGRQVRLALYESDGSLSLSLHAGHALGGACTVSRPGFRLVDWVARVKRVSKGGLAFDRPLRVGVRREWGPELLPFEPTVSEVGVEHLTLEFPPTEKYPHHSEPGYNAIYFDSVNDSWVRDVRVVNFDGGIVFWKSWYTTADDLLLEGRGGHYGLSLGACQDSLMTNFVIRNQSIHDLSVSNLASGNVFSRGHGLGINFDHHRNAPYENLFSDIDVGRAWRNGRIWHSTPTPRGHSTAARPTFWNIRPQVRSSRIPKWPEMLVIGPLKTQGMPVPASLGRWVEHVPELEPRDLHVAQRERRWGRR